MESSNTTSTPPSSRVYPWTSEIGDLKVRFRLMRTEDREAILAFTRELPERDLLFLRTDITRAEVVDAWIRRVEQGHEVTVLAEEIPNPTTESGTTTIVGFCSLHLSNILWTRHLGEIHLLVSSTCRGKGLGGQLARQVFNLAQGYKLHKLVAQMMSTQRTSESLFHHLGFIPEAMLHDWVIDRNGRTHDLIVMSREVDDDELQG